MNPLEQEILEMIVEVCKIAEPIPEDFSPEAPLIGPESPLGIDSLDAVEIVFTLQKRYNLRIDSEDRSREVLQSLKTLAGFVGSQREIKPL
ncbi:MAG: acyl carrier protein [Proteobacteria bacterium]|nr:acyl carrier protein [Pseudomonadota bacterium]MBU1710661.1 acyl carrier protein [Pseudomonadota bacterium]